MSSVAASHILLDERGVAWIDETNIKAIEVALERIAHGQAPEEIHDQHQGYLSLAQIHAALAYYYDHQDEMDAEIERQLRDYEQGRAASLDTPGRQRLRSMGKLS